MSGSESRPRRTSLTATRWRKFSSSRAAAQLAQNSVRPDAPRRGARPFVGEPVSDEGERRVFEQRRPFGVGAQQPFDGVAQRGVSAAMLAEKGVALPVGEFDGVMEKFFDLFPVRGG